MITYQMHRRIESESPREYLNSTTVKVMFFSVGLCVCVQHRLNPKAVDRFGPNLKGR